MTTIRICDACGKRMKSDYFYRVLKCSGHITLPHKYVGKEACIIFTDEKPDTRGKHGR